MTDTMTGARIEHEIGQHGRLHLSFPDGELHVRAVDGTLATVVEATGLDLAADFTIQSGPASLSLRPRARFALSFDRPRPVLAVTVPRGASVSIETASGQVRTDGLRGPQRHRSASGRIDVRDGAGDIVVDAVSGDVRVDGSGDVAVDIRTVSGEVAVRAARVLASAVSTTSGDIRLEGDLTAGGAHTIRTVSGDATIATATGLRVEAKTLSGHIAGDRSRWGGGVGRRQVILGNGGTALAFSSISGNLRIVRPPDVPEAAATDRLEQDDPPGDTATELRPDPSADRLELLRRLERGEIDVATAMAQLGDREAPEDV